MIKKVLGTVLITLLLLMMFSVKALVPFLLIAFALLLVLSVKNPVLFLVVFLVIYEQGFQMFDPGISRWGQTDICVVLLGFALILQLIRKAFHATPFLPKSNKYFRYILWIFLVVFFSLIWGSFFVLQQPVGTLIFRARGFFLYLIFLYLYLADFSFFQIKQFFKFLVWSATFISVLVIIDAKLLGGGKIFSYAMTNGISGFRAGSARIAVYMTANILAYFYLLSVLKAGGARHARPWAFLACVVIFYQLFFCTMIRQYMIVLTLTTLVYLFRFSQRLRQIVVPFITACAIAVALLILQKGGDFSNSKVGQLGSIVQQTQYEMSRADEGNIAIRLNGIRFYYPYFKKTGFLGMGMTSITHKASPEYEGFRRYYLFADLGFAAVLFRFGVLSVLLVAAMFTSIFKDLSRILREGNDDVKIVASSIFYFTLSKIIFLPFSDCFFSESSSFYYGLLFYFISRMLYDLNCKRPEVRAHV